MINKLKHIDNSRKDLQSILETKGVDLTNSNKSLDSLIANVGQLSLNNEVNPDTWEGVMKQDDPGKYWKGDEDWKDLIDIDAIMEADTNEYQGKVFFLIRCSDNPALNDYSEGYTARAIVGLQAFRFSDSGMDETSSTTNHAWDASKDIIAPNGERFRWIIGYTSSTTAVMLWQSRYLIPEAVVYWSGTFRGICFEDAPPAGSSGNACNYAYDNGSGGYSYYTSFSITNYSTSYLMVQAPRYFEVKEAVTTQFVIGDYGDRYTASATNYRTRTIIVDGTVVCEFMRNHAYACTYARFTKPGYRRYLNLQLYSREDKVHEENAYVYADVSGCQGTIWCCVSNGYVELHGDIDAVSTLQFSKMYHTNILAGNVWTLAGAEGSTDCNFECAIIHGNINERCFMDWNGHIKFDYIEQNIGTWAFWNAKYIPTEIIVKQREDDTAVYTMGHNPFLNTDVEKIDLRDSGITALSSTGLDPETVNNSSGTHDPIKTQPFYGAKKLKIIHLPKNMTSIPAWGLSRLPSVTTITLPENLVTINQYAFADCPLLESIVIPATIQTIGTYAFSGCGNLKTLEINSDITDTIPERMCNQCTSLEKVILPEKLVKISVGAFASCYNLENVILPNTVTNIADYAFEYNYKLKSIQYEDPSAGAMMYLGAYCFQECHSLIELFDLSSIVDGMRGNSIGYDYLYHPFLHCFSMTFTLLSKKPTNLNDSYYYQYFYRLTGAKILVPEDYAYTGTLQLYGANWEIRNFLDFIQSIPDRTGGTATKFALGADYRNTGYKNSATDVAQPYSIYPTVYSKYYVKEIDGVLEYSTTQEDDTWILVSDYVAAKNCTLS